LTARRTVTFWVSELTLNSSSSTATNMLKVVNERNTVNTSNEGAYHSGVERCWVMKGRGDIRIFV
jgi:hypothetical protein